jgi:hypothetical protein
MFHITIISFVEVEILLGSLHYSLVSLVEILLGYDVSILSHCLHSGLLTDACDIGSTDLVGSTHVLLEIHIL